MSERRAMNATIIEAIQVGDAATGARPELLGEAEFQALYRRHGRALWAYLYRLTGRAADADDLVQEAFCRLLATRLATRDDSQLRAYLFRIASNQAVDHWRRQDREKRRDEAAAVEGTVADHGDAVMARRDMARTFQLLKPQERILLWLAHVEAFEHREIAAALGLKASSVPVLLVRARKKLAHLLTSRGLAG
jgi:RNA polymerase sigma-70 factor (ECF subfamily)